MSDEHKETMERLAERIDKMLNFDLEDKQVGFVIMVFPIGYISTVSLASNGVEEADAIELMRGLVEGYDMKQKPN